MADATRVRRMSGHIKKEVAQILQAKFQQPDMGLITVTNVKVSRDLGYADIYVTFLVANQTDLDQEAGNRARLDILTKAAGAIRADLAHTLKVRTIPSLRFHFDDLSVTGPKMERLIRQARAKDLQAPSEPD